VVLEVSSATGSIHDIIQRLLLWGGRAAPGLAKVEYSSEFSRQAVINQLRSALREKEIALHEIQLPTYQSPKMITDFLNQTLDQYNNGLVSITGFTTAFDSKVPLADAFRQLNMNREQFAHRPLQQIWWMLPIFSQNSLWGMEDLTSWFMPRLRLTEIILPDDAISNRIESLEQFSHFDEARRRAYRLIEQFQSANANGRNTSELLNLYLLPALEALTEVNAFRELTEITSQFAGLLNELKESSSPDLLEVLRKLGILYRKQGRYSESEALFKRILTVQEKSLDSWHSNLGSTLNDLAFIYLLQGRYSEAEPLCMRALSICEEQLGENHPETGNRLNNLALLYASTGRYAEAEPLYVRALGVFSNQLGKEHPDTQTVISNFIAFIQTAIAEGAMTQLSDHPMTQATIQSLSQSTD
jgi:tetratricopeptide (TPR) repeat protein